MMHSQSHVSVLDVISQRRSVRDYTPEARRELHIPAEMTAMAPIIVGTPRGDTPATYPVIRHLPELYESKPNDPSSRKIGSYLMWVAIAATSVTSSMFLTAMAPNLIAIEIVKKTPKLEFGWTDWFIAFAPVGILLLLATPLLAYWLYPPQIKAGEKIPAWAAQELDKLGVLTRREIILALLVVIALVLWIFGGDVINATTVALLIVSLMLVARVVSWDDIIRHSAAWNTLAWFATLLALADGLSRVGIVKWFAQSVAQPMSGLSPITAMVLLVAVFFFIHLLLLIFGLLVLHVTEIWLFGIGYFVLLHDQSLGQIKGSGGGLLDLVYFLAVVYTTLGLGDLVPAGAIRFMTGMEALTGFVLITWSASFTFLEMQKFWRND